MNTLDPALTSSEIFVADSADRRPPVDTLGPFRVVVPRETRQTRSVRRLGRLELARIGK